MHSDLLCQNSTQILFLCKLKVFVHAYQLVFENVFVAEQTMWCQLQLVYIDIDAEFPKTINARNFIAVVVAEHSFGIISFQWRIELIEDIRSRRNILYRLG